MFENIWETIKNHIAPLLTASNIVLLVTIALTLLPKFKKIFSANAEASATLAKKLNEVNEIAGELKSLKSEIAELSEANENSANTQAEIKELMELASGKLNAVLEIQKTAYGAEKISDVKDAITTIYTNARFDTSAQRKKMAQGAREAVEKVTKLATEVTEQLVEIEHAAEPKESGHMATITL